MKIEKKLLIVIMILIMLVSILVGSTKVNAATSVTIQGTDTPHSIEITRNVKDVTNPVTNTYTYIITPDEGNPTGTEIPESAKNTQIVFNNETPNTITNIATKKGTIDFTGAKFTQVGDYKFVVSETASTDTSKYPVATNTYEIFVSVRYEIDEDKIPTGNLIATLASQARETGKTDKSDIIFPSAKYSYITVAKNVTGNMADKEEYFKFKLEIAGGKTGDTYTILGQDESISYNSSTVETSSTYTVGQDNYVYLKHGQTITIGKDENEGIEVDQIKAGETYKITEQDATDYETFIDGSTSNSKETTKGTKENANDNKTTIVNNKEEATLTGVFFELAPYLIAVVIATVGIVVFGIAKKNSKE